MNGVLAGWAAGMTVFGFAGLTAPAKLIEAGAALVLSHMRESPGVAGLSRALKAEPAASLQGSWHFADIG